MYTLLFVLLVLVCLVLVAAILLQAGKGNGLASSFGGASSAAEAVIGSRQAGNLLTRTTWWAGGLFVGLSFILGLMGARQRAPRSVLDNSFAPTNRAAPASTGPAGAPAGAQGVAPAVPLTPATPATTPNGAAPAPPAGTAPRR
ncbi:hypothetical protein tb265_38220 [Gemmatimonadetes bacterium T265]|nr:hypothetical protein tb265_38220 [Gemmatimonadetes bacterium T265]